VNQRRLAAAWAWHQQAEPGGDLRVGAAPSRGMPVPAPSDRHPCGRQTVPVPAHARRRPVPGRSSPSPFVKWVGGKRTILPEVLGRIPCSFDAYYEPFLGGGAVFFALDLAAVPAHLSDTNRRLIDTYRAVRNEPETVIRLLEAHADTPGKDHYMRTRDRFNSGNLSRAETAAAFIYLNFNCFNGVYRENASGGFNVPWRPPRRPWKPDVDRLLAASKALQGTTLDAYGFESTPVDRGGFYYLDPPYHETFGGYSHERFDGGDHRRLADWCRRLDAAGARWLLSNSDTPLIRGLYAAYHIRTVSSLRVVGGVGAGRGRVPELLVSNFELDTGTAGPS